MDQHSLRQVDPAGDDTGQEQNDGHHGNGHVLAHHGHDPAGKGDGRRTWVRRSAISVMSATSKAASVPVPPMATETSAAARAGVIVDPVADHGHHVTCRPQRADCSHLFRGSETSPHLIDAELLRHSSGGRPVIAREHHRMPDAGLAECGHQLPGILAGPDR